MTFFRLFHRFILRALAREKVRSGFTALGISLGVGVMIAIRLANLSALDSFKTATESIAGETSVQVTGAAGRFDETLLRDLGWLRDYGQVSPVIEGYALFQKEGSGPEAGEFLHVLGIDILRDRSLRRYQLLQLGGTQTEVTSREFLALLTEPQAIVVTEKFALTHGLAIDDRLPLVMGEARREYIVRGLLRDEGPARTLDGNFVLMDIAAAQLAFDRLGQLDRADVKLREGMEVEKTGTEIADRLPPGLRLARPEATYNQVEKMISAFHFNLNALGSIALLVGLFLIYNTVSISVITRRAEVGTLRAIGASRRTILSLFLSEAILLALAGTVIGLGIGRLLASAAVRATATTVDTFYIAAAATESVARHTLTLADVLLAFAVALPLSLVAAILPAWEASAVRPIEAMRGAERLASGFRPTRMFLFIALALALLGYGLSFLPPVKGLPVFGYVAALTLMFGGAFLIPHALLLACRLSGRLIGLVARRFRVEARLASANLRGAIPRVSISVAALAVSLGMMVAISIMIGSFRETISYWVGQSLVADIYVKAVTRTTTSHDGEIAGEAVELLRADPGVEDVYTYSSQPLTYADNQILLGSSDFSIFAKQGRLLFKQPADGRERMAAAIGQDEIVATESFALRFGKRVGDVVELPTTKGVRPFRLVAVYYDYSSNRGVVVMDGRTHAKYFNPIKPSSVSVFLKAGADADEVRDRLARAAGNRYQLIVTTNQGVRGEVVRIFDSTFAITYALELIAIVVAGLGVISTLITLILERRNELAMLTFLGASRAQIRRMIVIEALLIGAVSEAVGALIGAAMSLVLIYVINVQSFGWTIQFHFPALFLLQSAALILLVTAAAGLYPAARATKVEVLAYE